MKSDVLLLLAPRVTPRDRLICELLWEHRVMTTTQLGEVAFAGSLDRAKHRLVQLRRLGILRGFRPFRGLGLGSSPYHYVLGEVGAAIVAAQRGVTVRTLGYRREEVMAMAQSQRLEHIVGINDVYTGLAAATRRRRDATLLEWWSERRCAELYGAVVRPDAYGKWREGNSEGDFFLEYDRGTEPTGRLASKVEAYARLAAGTGEVSTVLVWLPGSRREVEVRKALKPMRMRSVPLATAHAAGGQGPADAVWLPLGQHRRVTLAALLATAAGDLEFMADWHDGLGAAG